MTPPAGTPRKLKDAAREIYSIMNTQCGWNGKDALHSDGSTSSYTISEKRLERVKQLAEIIERAAQPTPEAALAETKSHVDFIRDSLKHHPRAQTISSFMARSKAEAMIAEWDALTASASSEAGKTE